MTQSSKHRIPFKPRRRGSSAHLAGFSSRQGSRFIYTYDSMGRMLTRDDGTDLTTFTWDHWDCIKEVTGESETVYHIPQGQILSFIRDGVTYQAHTCALGSIRMIADEAGEVVARYDFDAWGRAISVTEDSALAGFPMRFVGALGVRTDATTGLVYMRARWYDSRLGRFISRDPIGLEGGENLYAYGRNNPTRFVDPSGLWSVEGVLLLLSSIRACQDIGCWAKSNNSKIYDLNSAEGKEAFANYNRDNGNYVNFPPPYGAVTVDSKTTFINLPQIGTQGFRWGGNMIPIDDMAAAPLFGHELSHEREYGRRAYKNDQSIFNAEVKSAKCAFAIWDTLRRLQKRAINSSYVENQWVTMPFGWWGRNDPAQTFKMNGDQVEFVSPQARQEFVDELIRANGLNPRNIK